VIYYKRRNTKWVIAVIVFLVSVLIGLILKWMANYHFVCFDEELCNTPMKLFIK